MKTSFALLIVVALVATSCTNYYVEDDHYDVRLIGSYEVEEYSDTYHETVYYSMFVSKDYGSENGIFLEHFYIENITVFAHVNGDRISIPFQVVDGFEIEGSGNHYRGEITLDYRVKDRLSNAPADYCETIAFRE
jgi:hypothetical protein